jgi:carboxymethylenebutenolidase
MRQPHHRQFQQQVHLRSHLQIFFGNTYDMRITLPSGTEAELVRHPQPLMGLVIAPDIFGLRPLFDEMVQRLSDEWQMSVIAVEPFPGRGLGAEIEPRMAAIPELKDVDAIRDLHAAADELGTEVTGLLGFCMGGMYCFKAARDERFARIASFYGMIVMPPAWRGPGHDEPLANLINGYADSVLSIVGGKDPYTPEADIAQLRATGANIVFYPEAEHGFAHDASRPSHRIDDAADAFARTKAWLLSALN